MSQRAFLDTNVLVYALDTDEPAKRERALRLLESHAGPLVISTQVLQELYAVVTRKLERPLPEVDAEEACRRFARLPVVSSDHRLVLRAIGLTRSSQVSIWDALIVTAAQEGGCDVVYSEDLQDGQVFGGVTVENPFAEL